MRRDLHVGAARLHADLPQDRDRGVAQALILLVGQGQGRREGDRVAGVDAHRVHVLDRADDDAVVGAVAHHLQLVLLPAEHGLLDQNLVGRRGVEPVGDHVEELLAIVGDAAAGAAHGEARPDNRRHADDLERRQRLLVVVRDGRAGALQPDPRHRVLETQAVLGLVDRVGLGADHFDAELREGAIRLERQRRVERRLAAHGGQKCVGALLLDDAGDDLRRDRLDIGRVRQLRIGHDRGRVGVDQDDPVAVGLQRLHRLAARIVELAGLADDDRPRPDDEDRGDVGALGHGAAGREGVVGAAYTRGRARLEPPQAAPKRGYSAASLSAAVGSAPSVAAPSVSALSAAWTIRSPS